MSLPKLDNEKIWFADCNAYGENFVVELKPSKQHTGYYHISVMCLADKFIDESTRPVNESGVEGFLQFFLKNHGIILSDLTWHENKTGSPIFNSPNQK